MLFSATDKLHVLKGTYTLVETFSFFDQGGDDKVLSSEVILGGKVYGLLGTDELRHDLSIGILWGTPVALFIGASVAIISTFVGLIYGLIASYKGKRTEASLMMIWTNHHQYPHSLYTNYSCYNYRQEHLAIGGVFHLVWLDGDGHNQQEYGYADKDVSLR